MNLCANRSKTYENDAMGRSGNNQWSCLELVNQKNGPLVLGPCRLAPNGFRASQLNSNCMWAGVWPVKREGEATVVSTSHLVSRCVGVVEPLRWEPRFCRRRGGALLCSIEGSRRMHLAIPTPETASGVKSGLLDEGPKSKRYESPDHRETCSKLFGPFHGDLARAKLGPWLQTAGPAVVHWCALAVRLCSAANI